MIFITVFKVKYIIATVSAHRLPVKNSRWASTKSVIPFPRWWVNPCGLYPVILKKQRQNLKICYSVCWWDILFIEGKVCSP